jgi:Domain of unknown function (DUF4157)
MRGEATSDRDVAQRMSATGPVPMTAGLTPRPPSNWAAGPRSALLDAVAAASALVTSGLVARRATLARAASPGAPSQPIRVSGAGFPGLRHSDHRKPSDGGAAAEFAAELARHRAERPRPVPVVYQPLVTAIVGERPVQLATGTASRRALARVGKRAATTGDTIHLATPRPSAEVLAHELTHVAHPSPVPRFFDDDDRSPEERRAEQVAAIIRRSPILPRSTAATDSTLRRTATAATSPGTISAAELAGRITGGGGAAGATASSGVIQRQIGSHRARLAPAQQQSVLPPLSPPMAQPAVTINDGNDANRGNGANDKQSGRTGGAPDLSTQFDRILELLEDRILRELERRGGRFRGGF